MRTRRGVDGYPRGMEFYEVPRAVTEALASLDARASELSNELRRARVRIERLELFVEALLHLAHTKNQFTVDEWQATLLRVDLADGIEDGKRNPNAYRGAPMCPRCHHYVNPQRSHCVYCDAPQVDPSVQGGNPYRGESRPRSAEPKRVPCARCHSVVAQTDSYFSGAGELVCAECFQSG